MTDKFLIQIGRITVNFQVLEHYIRWVILSYQGKNKEPIVKSIFESDMPFKQLTTRLRELNGRSNINPTLKLKTTDLIEEANKIADKRNRIIHSTWWTNSNNVHDVSMEKKNVSIKIGVRDLKKTADTISRVSEKIMKHNVEIINQK